MLRRLYDNGPDSFSSHELLEILLYSTNKRGDTNPTAHRLMRRFGSMEKVLTASEEELIEVEGVGEVTAHMIHAMGMCFEYILSEQTERGKCLGTAAALKEYCADGSDFTENGIMYIILMDNEYNLISSMVLENVPDGDPDKNEHAATEAVTLAVLTQSPVVALVRSCQGRITAPSQCDITFLRTVSELFKAFNIYLCDYILTANGSAVSLRENKLLSDIW